MKKTKLTRSLLAACSIVALSAVVYGCSSGISQGEADRQAAEAAAAAQAAAEAAAAAAAAEAAAQAEAEKQAAIEAERKAVEERAAAAEKMARATVQTNAITAAISAAEDALAMAVLGADDMDISDAETAVMAARDAITAAVDVDDTSTYTTQVDGIEGRLMTAVNLVQQDRAAKKAARADMQKGVIMSATTAAQNAVALVVVGASNDVIADAEAAVQAARDAIAAAVDVDDTSMYSETVDGIAGDLMTAKDTVLAGRLADRIELQTNAIDAAIRKARSELAEVVLGASDMDISEAEAAVQAARDAIAAAVDVEDTSMYTATVNHLASSLGASKTLVIADRAAKKAARAENQMDAITDAIEDAVTALAMVDIEADDATITSARNAVQAAKDAIDDAVDVDDTSMYAAQIDRIEGRLDTAEAGALAYRSIQQQDAIDMAADAAEDAVGMVGPDASDDDVADADTAVKALMDAIDDATNVDDTSAAMTALEGLQNALSDRKTLRTAIMDAMDALDDLDNDSSDDDIEDVQDLIDAAEDAIADAANLSDDEKAAFSAKIDADDTGLQAMLDAEEKTIMAARETAKTMAAEGMARSNGLAMALDAAKATAADGTFDDAGTDRPDLFNTGTNTGDGVTAMHDGSKVTLTVTETTNTARGAITKQDAGPASISGWTGQNFTRGDADDDMVGHFTVYTDIDAPKGMAFNAANLQAALGLASAPTVGGTTVAPTYDLPADNTDGVYDYVMWGSAARPSITDTTDADDDPDVDARSFTGSLAGAMGKFECEGTATTCALTFNEKDMIATLVGTWEFTANRGAKVNVPDDEYLYFGWWIDRPTKAGSDGSYSYDFQSFSGGVGAYTASNLDGVTGSATYNGAAAGVYVTKDISNGQITDATMGEFSAAAKLTANFGNATDPGLIGGSISDFKDADGSAMAGWGVTLNSDFLATGSATFAGPTTGTTGPGATGTGSWEGMFYGDATNADGTVNATAAPMGVAGRFDAHLAGAHIAGGFGASR